MQFPGMQYPIEFQATILRGPAPSRIIAVAAYEPSVGPGYGTLTLDSNGQGISLPAAGSCSYHLRHDMDRNNRVTMSATFLDRRWKWRFSPVSARFNVRLPDNSIRSSPKHRGFRRSAREIFAYLLSIVGDSAADVSAAPSNVFPHCEWDHVPVSEALAWLCRKTWCSLVLTSTNAVRVVRLGVGAPLQNEADQAKVNCVFRLGAVPAGMAVGCAPTRFQSRLLLEPIGLEPTGEIVHVDKLSYKPAGGWIRENPFAFPNVSQTVRHLAIQSVWRWFRIKSQASGQLAIPRFQANIVSADQYRPLPWLVDIGKLDGMPCHLPARVYGEYFPQQDLPKNTPVKANYPGSFRIIPEIGIVEFPFPIWKTYGDGEIVEPKLLLETGYHVADKDGFGLISARPRMSTGFNTATGDYTIYHPELWATHVVRYGSDGISVSGSSNNSAALSAEAGEYLRRSVAAISAAQQSTDIVYGGINRTNLDGLRSQAFSEAGVHIDPSTRVSQGIESDIFTHDEHIRRVFE